MIASTGVVAGKMQELLAATVPFPTRDTREKLGTFMQHLEAPLYERPHDGMYDKTSTTVD